MAKIPSLSAELTKLAALSRAGCAPAQVETALRAWEIRTFSPRRSPVFQRLHRWSALLRRANAMASELGASSASLLQAGAQRVREEERLLGRAESYRNQFALQGAIALVLPWAALALTGTPSLNPLLLAGAVLQGIGLAGFTVFVRRAISFPSGELSFLADLTRQCWIECLAGRTLLDGLATYFGSSTEPPLKKLRALVATWRQWFGCLGSIRDQADVVFSQEQQESLRLARAFQELLQTGAASCEVLQAFLEDFETRVEDRFEEKLSNLPTFLSLWFCVSFTPAFFLILCGGLWEELIPTLRQIS